MDTERYVSTRVAAYGPTKESMNQEMRKCKARILACGFFAVSAPTKESMNQEMRYCKDTKQYVSIHAERR